MKIILLLTSLSVCLSASGQFNTAYNDNGDPITEIIDASGMRQGVWSYYNDKGQIIRREEYQDHKLLKRVHYLDDKEVETTHFIESTLSVDDQLTAKLSKLKTEMSGEVVIDSNGVILTITIYQGVNDSDQVDKGIELIRSMVASSPGDHQNSILVF